jgi:hypothetical protein
MPRQEEVHLPDTDPDLEVRASPRYSFSRLRRIHLTAHAADGPLWAYVTDLSLLGIGLLCCTALPVASRLSLAWEFGPAEHHRTLKARVVYMTQVSSELWALGCEFETPLLNRDLQTVIAGL